MMPDSMPRLYNYRALAFTKLGRYREALQSYDQALSIDPKHIEALKNKQALLFALDSMGNVTLPEPPPTTRSPGLQPTKKPAPVTSYHSGPWCRRHGALVCLWKTQASLKRDPDIGYRSFFLDHG